MKDKLNLFAAFVTPISLILLGFNLIKKEDKIATIIGFANIFFWSALLLFTIYKKVIKKQ
ncbi:hypothetical protein [Flavobacterium sp. N1994]|uniref:hypothetical protein n=1 Tax=Flavobacterium sp. N1994 TaxID=2986827 RepID=UPI00222168DE|nr:hypothetical protein [Flavobacterium sp. N1994]